MWWHLEESDQTVRHQTVRELLPKILPLFRPHLRLLATAFGLLFIITASLLAGPVVLQYIIDHYIDMSNPEVAAIPVEDRIRGIIIAAGAYLVIAAGGAAVGYLQAITLFKLGINIITGLKSRLFAHVLRLGLDFHEDLSPGQLISRVESDTETLKELFSDVAVNLLRNFLVFVGILVVLCLKSWAIAAWILLFVPVLFVATFWFINFMKKYWREFRVQWAIVTGYVTEYVQGLEVIQQFNYQSRAKERMDKVNYGMYRINTMAHFIDYSFWGVFWFGEIIAVIIVLIVGVKGVVAGTVSIGILVMFIEFIRQMFFPIVQLSGQLNFIQRGLISIERVFGILETEPSVADGPRPADELSFNGEITFENVWFAYDPEDENGETNWILKDVSFTIPKGDKIALVGASGGGKSTIVNLLLRFYDPQQGRILVDGQDIREFPIIAYRNLIGLVLQDIFLFPGSVADNIRVFDEAISGDRVKEVTRIAKAEGIVERLPGGYDGELAERGANLSVGERQLLSFARALAYDPPLLVLDEATSSVDPHTERMVQEALERLLAGRTAVIVAHRLSTIINADRIMLIHKGRIAESGRHDELLEKDGLYAKLFRLQFGVNNNNYNQETQAGSEEPLQPEPGGAS